MDYTTLANVKQALGATDTTDDALLSRLVGEASRAIDRHVSGFMQMTDYFKSETVTDERGYGLIGADGNLLYFPKKPVVSAVAAFAWRSRPWQDWLTVSLLEISLANTGVVAWSVGFERGKAEVKLTYSGGLAASTATLPPDVINAADLLTVRFYREIKSGLGDAIGVAELGTLQYTKAWPVRVLELLAPYMRVTP
jgi:hypothetical protein